MAIAHELTSEIATALFTGWEKSQRELKDLKKMVFEIYSTLEGLTEQHNEKERKAKTDSPPLTRSFRSSI